MKSKSSLMTLEWGKKEGEKTRNDFARRLCLRRRRNPAPHIHIEVEGTRARE